MFQPHEDPQRTLETVRVQLHELGAVLAEVAHCLKQFADRNRRRLLELERTRPDPFGGLAGGLRARLDRAKEVSRKPAVRASDSGIPRFRYAQYLEFSTLAEFLKFKELPPIRREDIARVDWEELLRRLAAEAEEGA